MLENLTTFIKIEEKYAVSTRKRTARTLLVRKTYYAIFYKLVESFSEFQLRWQEKFATMFTTILRTKKI